MSGMMKGYGIQGAKPKSRERFSGNPSYSPTPISSNKILQRQGENKKERAIPNNITVNRPNPNCKITMQKTQNIIQSREFNIEGDLFVQSKQSNYPMNKNARYSPIQPQMQIGQPTRPGNFNPMTKHKPRTKPTKSPIQVPNTMNSQKYLPSRKSNGMFASLKGGSKVMKERMKMSEQMSKTFNNVKNSQNRSLSPVVKKKETTPQLSPNVRPTFISKSPVPGKHVFMDNFFMKNQINNNLKQKIKMKQKPYQHPITNVNVYYPNQGKKEQSKVFTMDMNQVDEKENNKLNNNNHNYSNSANNMMYQNNNSPQVQNNYKEPQQQVQQLPVSMSSDINSEKNQTNSQGSMSNLSKVISEKNSFTNQGANNAHVISIGSTQSKNSKIIKKIRNIHDFTHVGFDGKNDKENNQDSLFIHRNFANHQDYIFMSVCDGHGVEGHEVSGFIKQILPVDLSERLRNRNILHDPEVHEIIITSFLNSNDRLVEHENINSTFSGSTCVSVIYTPERLICPNIGDSRAVIGRATSTDEWIAIDLSRDHKPSEKDEEMRVIENEGRIQPFIEDGEFIGPPRVWVMEDDVPGLAMTRSFGDRVAATVGVISEPEIKEYEFHEDDKFMIIASDGVWEFIESIEVSRYVILPINVVC